MGTCSDFSLLCSDQVWLEGAAVEQFNQTASLSHIETAVGMPDIHPGKGHPVGAAFISKNVFYPYIVGGDIGCGMGFYQTELLAHKLKMDRAVDRMSVGVHQYTDIIESAIERYGLSDDAVGSALGTVGGGNHFAELQRVEDVMDSARFNELGLDQKRVYLLVHSGSRGLGDAILRAYCAEHGNAPLRGDQDEGRHYMECHTGALRWAKANRDVIARAMMRQMKTEAQAMFDNTHNSITQLADGRYLHRKGAAAADTGPFVLAGTRGTYSYLVQPINGGEATAFSLAHGAGRKWQRRQVRARLENRWRVKDLQKTELNGRVICADKNLLYEEAPQAYKDVECVLRELVDRNLVLPIARLRPMLTVKRGKAQR
jgi:release factor H-coupled RctB family protein